MGSSTTWRDRLRAGVRSDSTPETGLVAVHYGLLIAFIAATCVAGAAIMGGWANDLIDTVRRQLPL